ncbi:MAG: hypothetical protein P4L45_06815 [Ignavibacteriaceae bacterium]|nr:hypothetical protein [Ignavibacteriaceae bacterium]
MITAICTLFTVSSVAFAAGATNVSITPSTVITQDNIYDVLNYLGIDSSKYTKSSTPLESQITTVQDLKDAIQKFSTENKRILSSSATNTVLPSANSPMVSGTRSLSQTDAYSTYSLNYSITVTYSGNNSGNLHFTGAIGGSITIDSTGIGLVSTIENPNNFNLMCSASTATMQATVLVDNYLLVQSGYLYLNQQTINSTHNWQSSAL